jgi:hypothetical protein
MLQPAAAGSSSWFVVYYAKQRAAGQHPVTLVRPLRTVPTSVLWTTPEDRASPRQALAPTRQLAA